MPLIIFAIVEAIAIVVLIVDARHCAAVRQLVAEHGIVCQRCHYPLRGIDATRCPECGAIQQPG